MGPQEQVEQKLAEQAIKKMHPHFLEFVRYYFLGILFLVAGIALCFYVLILGAILLLIGVFTFLVGEISRRAETYCVFENGVEREYKMFSSSHKFVEYRNIHNMEVDQSFFQTIFGIGNMKFDTAGGAGIEEELIFKGIKHPHEIEAIVQERMRK